MTVTLPLLLGTVFLKIVFGNEENMTFGIADDVKPGTLLSNYVLPPPEDYTFMRFFSTNNPIACSDRKYIPREYVNLDYMTCMCDDQCGAYDDCCTDAPSNITKYNDKLFECVKLSDELSIYIATSCPSSFKDVEVVKRCKLQSKVEEMASDMATNLPVSDMKTNITYGNVHCAKCNGVDEAKTILKYWKTNIHCRFQYRNLTERLQHVKYNKCTLLGSIMIEPKLYQHCTIHFKIPSEVENNVRICVPNLISSCSPDRKDGKLEDKCSGFMSLASARNILYRNEHCARCRGVDEFRTASRKNPNPKSRETRSTNVLNNQTEATLNNNNRQSADTNHPSNHTNDCNEKLRCKNITQYSINRRSGLFTNCYCDNQCYLYEDCCDDVVERYNTRPHNMPRFQCVQVSHRQHIYMIISCPRTWKDKEISKKCSSASNLGSLEYDVPVTDIGSNITYRNKFCAKCNNIFEGSNLVSWTTTFNCLFSYEGMQDRMKNMKFDAMSNMWVIQFKDNPCNISVNSWNLQATIRRCVPNVVNSCNSSWENSNVSSLCKSNRNLIYLDKMMSNYEDMITDNFIYQNEYCAYCNNQTRDKLTWCPILGNTFYELKPQHYVDPFFIYYFTTLFKSPIKTDGCTRGMVTIGGIVLSFILIILHLISFFKENQKSCIEKCVACYASSLLVMNLLSLLLNILQFYSYVVISIYYACVSSFLWTLSVSYELFSRFYLRKCYQDNLKKFMKYSAVCLFIPLILSLLIVLDIKGFGYILECNEDICLVSSLVSTHLIFLLPCFLTLSCSVILLVITLYSFVKGDNKDQKLDYNHIKYHGGLIFLVALTWVTCFVGNITNDSDMLAMFSLLNTGQSVYIFTVFTSEKIMRCTDMAVVK